MTSSATSTQPARPAAATPAVEGQQYLTFVVGGELFAIGILRIKEIIEYGGITTVPMMPACIRGVINLRGAVVPVLDLSARFGRAPATATRRTCIVIVEVESAGEAQDIGVIVDAVNEVLEIPGSDVEPAPSFGARMESRFIRAMGKVNGRFVIILDTDQVLAEDMLGEVAAAGTAAEEPQAA